MRDFYLAWLRFIDGRLEPWTTGGALHFRPHWACTLMNAPAIADGMGLPDADLRSVAMAAVFHDSRRKSPFLDVRFLRTEQVRNQVGFAEELLDASMAL